LKWLQERFGQDFKNYILIPHKHVLARKGVVLIDDTPKKVTEFRAAGRNGDVPKAIIFPRKWNTPNKQDCPDPVYLMQAFLESIQAEINE
jgi:hypothetical protein